jgi:hypothetical protein
VAKKKSQQPPQSNRTEPVPVSTVAVPSALGEGEVRLYDLRKSRLPEVAVPPPEMELAEWSFWLVHFPSRRCAPVKGDRGEALAAMKKLGRGQDMAGVLPAKPAKITRARARVCVTDEPAGEAAEAGHGEPKPPANRMAYTSVPEGADFDQAMAHVFPVARLTQHFERLLMAEEDVFDKDGNCTGSKPAFATQFQTLKALTEWHQGRPREREKKKDTRPVLGIQELRQKLLISPEYRQAMLEMIRDCEAQAAAMAGSGTKPPAGG